MQKVTDKSFGKYGRVLDGYALSGLLEAMKHTPLPDEVIYVSSAHNEASWRTFPPLFLQVQKTLPPAKYHM